ncbi:hypothetical protein GCM10010211_61570 [Streptomyces albospinus]|uniref:Transposase n=1 Tax=Streptomyces albospinus TaxID=285515 RepID=A0ABQ2VJN9_9ACTN|nr:hypothetical protein GCM10010211_61570 [Streptomyces albospinus]
MRKPRRQASSASRPADADGRTVPGHRADGLITGKGNASAIGTLVERATRYVMLVHLPHGRGAAQVCDAQVETVGRLPTPLAI